MFAAETFFKKTVTKIFNCTKKRPCVWRKPYKIKNINIISDKMLLSNYDQIMTNAVKNAIKRVKNISDISTHGILGFGIENGHIIWFDPKFGVLFVRPCFEFY